jgi:hypothetical protein
VERRDPQAGRPLKGVPPVPVSPRPAVPRVPARVAPRKPGPGILALILWPALLTLGVTLLRLLGELWGWSPSVFSRVPGGGLSPLGITWLAPIVGFYLGWRLERAGVPSPPAARALGAPAAAFAVGFLLATLAERALRPSWTANFALWAVAAVAVAAAAFAAWPALGRPLLAYAYAARVPVAVVMALAIWRSWGTHYDLPPPGFPLMPRLQRWLWIALLPQTTIWVAWTMATGVVFGALGWRAARRRL